MSQISKLKCLVWDNGLDTEYARRLAREFGDVAYFTDFDTGMVHASNLMMGWGNPEITRVKHPWRIIDNVDLLVFPHAIHPDLQEWFREKGKLVWGSGQGGDLEHYRPELQETLREVGLPVNDYEIIKGMDSLREHLKKNPNRIIKVSLLRGDWETLIAKTYADVKGELDEREVRIGPPAEIMEFMSEKPIDPAVEGGSDGWSVDGAIPLKMHGFELKDKFYVCTIMDSNGRLPEPVEEVNRKLAPVLFDYKYRGPMHTEVRIAPDEKGYLIDFTARNGSPPTECMQEMITNLGEVAYYGAQGKVVPAKVEFKYGLQAKMTSEYANEHWQPVHYPEEIDRWVKLLCHTRINGIDYAIPESKDVPGLHLDFGWVVGVGQTIPAAAKALKDHADQITGRGIEVDLSDLEKTMSEIEELENMGFNFSNEPLPSEKEMHRALV